MPSIGTRYTEISNSKPFSNRRGAKSAQQRTRNPVAQNGILLYRGLIIRVPARMQGARAFGSGLLRNERLTSDHIPPNTIRRNSRLKICATPRARLQISSRPASIQEFSRAEKNTSRIFWISVFVAFFLLAPLLLSFAETNTNLVRQTGTNAVTEPEPDLVSFPSGTLTLHGFLWKPQGAGPFPAIIYNHGSEKLPGSFPSVAKFFTAEGFIFFVPHRHGHGRSPGEYIVDLQEQARAQETNEVAVQKKIVALHELYNADVVAAIEWLKKQPAVDPKRLVVAGVSYGGIQTVLTAEKQLGIKGCVAFAPAAMSWRGNPELRERLRRAVLDAKVPIFLLQATNDYNLGPSHVLGAELNRKPAPNQSKIYPAFGDPQDPRSGHGKFAVQGSAVWGKDVMNFIKVVLQR